MEEMSVPKHFHAGEVIFKEGDPPGALYIIESGIVEISTMADDARIVLAQRKEKEVFGEMALVDSQPRSATATAVGDVYAHVISEELFESYLNELNPLLFHIFSSLVTSIREMNETQALIANIIKLRGGIS
ncbi:MAG: cyclic nucleotide-binding domain-containing protein [Rickettsiales bacterium]|nr:cyclic nucleotide-binding domain-containing protein [Rickettsiales bacterium]